MPNIFCAPSEVAGLSGFRGRRFGLPWTPAELGELRALFLAGNSLSQLCRTLGRPVAGAIPQAS